MRIAIIGGGVAGLTSAYFLGKKGHKTVIFEQSETLGGLVSGFKVGQSYLERFYHHLFASDRDMLDLVDELGLSDKVLWYDSGAPIYYQGRFHPFASAQDLLRFSPISLPARLRTGLVSLYLQKGVGDFRRFEGVRANQWLKKYMGDESFRVIWEPLMKKKWGKFADEIAMTWVWARIHTRTRKLAYPRGGFRIIIDALEKAVKRQKGVINLKNSSPSISELKKDFDRVIVTTPPSVFAKLAPELPDEYKRRSEKIAYQGAINLLLFSDRPILPNKIYWLNINDYQTPFLVAVQQTNFVPAKYYGGKHILYLGVYTPPGEDKEGVSDEQIFSDWTSHLKKINPEFNLNWIEDWRVNRERFTQPIVKIGYEKLIPSLKTPLKNVYLASMAQVYPEDRGTNYAVRIGRQVSESLD